MHRDVELIIQHALSMWEHSSSSSLRRHPAALVYLESSARLHRFPHAPLSRLPLSRSMRHPILALQYRFEGVRRHHLSLKRRQRIRTYAPPLLILLLLFFFYLFKLQGSHVGAPH